MTVSDRNERRYITLPVSYWKYLEEKAAASKQNCPWYGRHTPSKMIENLITNDMKLKKAGFLDGK